ncbi:MAG: hypothetical protein OSB39_03735 [Opitutales bacterium]|nr:hypothetical protein [Opitutales bacterium]
MNRLFCSLLILAMLSSSVLAEDSAALKSIKEIGGFALPLANGEWEVEFHLRGRDLMTDEGLELLPALGKVVSLNLRDTRITGAGLVNLKKLKGLRRLHLERTRVDDAGIAHLAGLTRLEYLNLYGTGIGDEGLIHLEALKNLKQIYLWQTKVTDAGAKRLLKALPDLRLSRGVVLAELMATYKAKPKPEPKEVLKWIPAGDAKPPKSRPGSFIYVNFENKRDQAVKLYWVEYGGGLKLYGEIEVGATRRQTTYSDASWLVTDLSDKHLGHFRTGLKEAIAVIP